MLKGLSFKIEGGHKIGIVGRTGAGKSTISLALTRIIEMESGKILIDGKSIGDHSIEQLRQKITIIPQDPTLFTGTLRFNVDPEKKATDEEILELLEKSGLSHLTTRESSSSASKVDLETGSSGSSDLLGLKIQEGGENLSSGEKSLLCICRAILRKNKVVILDEATANIDLTTEQKIQTLIKNEFKDCTVLTIAHRLQTIIESDKILVLDNGQTAEFDEPQTLLKDPESHFTHLVNEMKNSGNTAANKN